MGGRFLKGLAYLALFAVIALTSCQGAFAGAAGAGMTIERLAR